MIRSLWSFAAVTDDPEPEVWEAAHNRTIVYLKPEFVDIWLNPDPESLDAFFCRDGRPRASQLRTSQGRISTINLEISNELKTQVIEPRQRPMAPTSQNLHSINRRVNQLGDDISKRTARTQNIYILSGNTFNLDGDTLVKVLILVAAIATL